MPWQCTIKRIELIALPGTKYALKRTVTYPDPNQWRQSICKIMTWLGDHLTAGRRRSWFYEGIYSKTTPGFIGYQLVQDLLLYGRHAKKPRAQYRMSWDRYSSKWMRYEF